MKNQQNKCKGLFGTVKLGEEKSCIAYCKPLAKYHLNENKWKRVKSDKEIGKAFSVVKYNTEFGKKANDSNSDFDYFILLDSMRVENYSKRGTTANNSGWSMGNYLTELDKSNKRIKALSFLVDQDGPLEDESKFLAQKINQLKEMDHCKNIHVLGVSKCGDMVVSMLKYLSVSHLDKLNVLAAQAPYLGTIMASPKILYAKTNEVIGKVPSTLLKRMIPNLQKIRPTQNPTSSSIKQNSLAKILTDIHWNVFSQSHMDYDISLVGKDGVPHKHQDRYDKNFLANLFDEKTLTRLRQVDFTNITTTCTPKTVEHSLKSLNASAFMLYISSQVLFDEPSDGMVPLSSSQYIEQVCKEHCIPIATLRIKDGHHAISGDTRMVKQIVQQKIITRDSKNKEEQEDILSH